VTVPRVVSIEYRFRPESDVHDYSKAPPWTGPLGDFDARLDDGVLTAIPTVDFLSADDARASIEPHLAAWRLNADLAQGVVVAFDFERADVVTPGVNTGTFLAARAGFAGVGTVRIEHDDYPTPAMTPLATSPLVGDLVRLLHDIRARGPYLLATANLLLTRIEYEFGGKPGAARALRVSGNVLDALGRLSVVNDPRFRRKVEGDERALTDAELLWIDEAARRVVGQVAQTAASGSPTRVTMGDLPRI
jgi:hypothetical protein